MNVRKKLLAALLGSVGVIVSNSNKLIAWENKKAVTVRDCENRKRSLGNEELKTKNDSKNFQNENEVLVESDDQIIRKEYEKYKQKRETMIDLSTKQFKSIDWTNSPKIQKLLLTPIGSFDYINTFPTSLNAISSKKK